jgi:hypothetical protein
MPNDRKPDLRCSFCDAPSTEVGKLVAGKERADGSTPYICDECIELCCEIITGVRTPVRLAAKMADYQRKFAGNVADLLKVLEPTVRSIETELELSRELAGKVEHLVRTRFTGVRRKVNRRKKIVSIS